MGNGYHTKYISKYECQVIAIFWTDLKKLGSPIFFVSCNASTLPREADISETCIFVQIQQNHLLISDLCVILATL